MELPSKHLQRAVDQFASLPSIGKRSALRLVLELLKRSPSELTQFAEAIQSLRDSINFCSTCGNISDNKICSICSDVKRNHQLICIVEDIRDVMAIEATSSYKGVFHVLGGVISPMDGIGPEDLNLDSLLNRVQKEQFDEIIFALSATMEGDTTNFYLYKKLSPFHVKMSTLSRGVPIGSEIEYADELTLGRAILQRLPYESTFFEGGN